MKQRATVPPEGDTGGKRPFKASPIENTGVWGWAPKVVYSLWRGRRCASRIPKRREAHTQGHAKERIETTPPEGD